MSTDVTAVVAVARCQHHRLTYGIRFEKTQPGEWRADWAFAIDAGQAHREGFDATSIEGDIRFTPAFPGCPGCGNYSTYVCVCGRQTCWDGQPTEVKCAWCGQVGRAEEIVRTLQAGQDS